MMTLSSRLLTLAACLTASAALSASHDVSPIIITEEMKKQALEEDRAVFNDAIANLRKDYLQQHNNTLDNLTPKESYRMFQQSLAQVTAHKGKRMQMNREKGLLRDITVQTQYGSLTGLSGATCNQFLGVPFATPPVGNLRWKAPQPPANWIARNATWFAPTCMQSETYWGILSGLSEDCLYLNIYVPSNSTPPPGGYPIMLFFYGGSYTYGGASFPLYDGITDVTLVHDVILATTNYRLNAFGFLAGDLLKNESLDGSVGGYGFQDQRSAILFMKNTATAFGGNPNRITIFGESAGGASVSNHLASPRSQGLFQGAIIESGSFSDWTAQPYDIAKLRLPELAKNLGCADAPDVLACMRAVNETTVLNKQNNLIEGQLEWSPAIDGVEVIDDPRVLAANGKIAPVPILLGFNHDEGTLFNSAPTDLNATEYLPAMETWIGADLAVQVAQIYPPTYAESPWWSFCAILRDSQMLCPGKDTGTWFNNPNRINGTKPVYMYYYTQVLALIDIVDIFKPLRCFHASELVSVFDFGLLLWGSGEPEMAKAFVSYWTNFAVNGNPNGPTVPQWNPYLGNSTTLDNIAEISCNSNGVNVTMINGLQTVECGFWDGHRVNESIIWG